MLQNLRQIAILSQIFNVKSNEWSRVAVAWMMRLFYRIGFVLGWTVIVGMFVVRYGIFSLPYLFVINAIFTILGTLLYSFFIDKVEKHILMMGTIAFVVLMLLAAFYLSSLNEVLFFAFLMVSISIFLRQFKILNDSFVEEMFNPLTSERVFPVIEAADTVAGILAGFLVVVLSGLMSTYSFIFLWIIFLLLIVPFIFISKSIIGETREEATLKRKRRKKREFIGLFTKIKSEVKQVKNIGFIKGLFLLVFLQWLIYNLLEFQYTKAVYQNVSNVILDGGSGFEHAFIHDLGAIFMFISFSALLVQFFIAGRLVNYLGVVGGMILHSVVILLSFFGLIASFNYYTAVMAKNNFTVGSVIYINSYHTSFYAVKDGLRAYTREVLEGVVRPIGAVVGTLFLLLVQKFFPLDQQVFYVNLLMVIAAIVFFYVSYSQQDQYTEAAIEMLKSGKSKKVRMNALDILSQKGHRNSFPIMEKILFDENESISLRIGVLKAFVEIKSFRTFGAMLKCLDSSSSLLRKATVDAFLKYKRIGRGSKSYLYLRYRLIHALKALYRSEKDIHLRYKIIRLISRISSVATVEFLLDIIKKEKGKLKAEAIYSLGNYVDPDIVEVILPFLEAKDLDQRVSALIALSKFSNHDEIVKKGIEELLRSSNPEEKAKGVFAVGELGMKKKRRFCAKYLRSTDDNLRLNSAIALAKMGYKESVPVLVELLFSSKIKVAGKVRNLLQNVDVRILKNIDKIVKHIAFEQVEEMYVDVESDLSVLSESSLYRLEWLYSLVEDYDEAEAVTNYLNKK